MSDASVGWVAAIIIGGIVGWLAEQFMKSQMGVLNSVVLGIVGAAIASAILQFFGIGWLGYLIAGFIGAYLLIRIATASAALGTFDFGLRGFTATPPSARIAPAATDATADTALSDPADKKDEFDAIWRQTDFAADWVWKEMDDFLARCQAEGPPETPEATERLDAEFLAILKRCNARTVEIYRQARAGDPAPHLGEI
jgi:uncharacterized membrane protein YeaQ/YmgE (transglycosylase-associated protein family)